MRSRLFMIGDARHNLLQRRSWVRKRQDHRLLSIRHIAVQHGRQLTSRQPPKRHQLGIKLHPQRLIGKDELRNARLREIQLNRLDVRRFLHHDADGDRHPKRLPGLVNLNRQPPSFSAALSLHVTSADITQGYKWGTGLFDPLLEKPPQVLTAFSRKDFLDRSPVRRVIAIAADEGLQAAPERLVSYFLPK